MSSKQTFSFTITDPAKRLKQLINNEYLSDVTFKVGSAGKLIYAHKMIITLASEVFFTQFNGSFAEGTAENKKPVVIEDIEPDTFLRLMNYIYCNEIETTYGNMLEIYYVAQKYLLQDLMIRCETHFRIFINTTNALAILDKNHRHRFTFIDEKCLPLIRDNPLMYFNQPAFLKLNQRTVEVIAASKTMNCKKIHLQEAIDNWKKANGSNKNEIIPKLEDLQCRKIKSFSNGGFFEDISTILGITAKKPLKLYGLGIFAGQKTPSGGVMTVTITIEGVNKVSLTKRIPFKTDLYAYKVLFERVEVVQSATIKIQVKPSGKGTALFGLEAFRRANDPANTNLQVQSKSPNLNYNDFNYEFTFRNCVAYLLYNQE